MSSSLQSSNSGFILMVSKVMETSYVTESDAVILEGVDGEGDE